MNRHHYGLILAGGRGTRFWPRSRKRSAKQVLNVVGERSLIQATVDRLAPVIPPERIWVLTNDHLRDIIIKQLPDVPPRQILAEPMQRNTAPADRPRRADSAQQDPDAVMGVFPSDHVIGRNPPYRAVVKSAFKAAGQGTPDGGRHPAAMARNRLRLHRVPQGQCSRRHGRRWPSAASTKSRCSPRPNATWPPAISIGIPACSSGAPTCCWRSCAATCRAPRPCSLPCPRFGSRKFAAQLKAAFPLCDNISIDYAVLEKAKASTASPPAISAGTTWAVGTPSTNSWSAIEHGNAIALESIALDSHNNFVDARGKVVALVGVHDLIVVDTPDALLVASRDRAQQVGDIVKALENRNRHDLL